ncbi:MAG: hypothetical protein ABS987_09030 [Ruminococcus sp.]
MFWDKNLRNAKKAEKKMEKRVKEAENLVKANDALTDIAQKKRSLAIPLPARHGTTSTSPVRSWMTRSARRVKTSLFNATACCSD